MHVTNTQRELHMLKMNALQRSVTSTHRPQWISNYRTKYLWSFGSALQVASTLHNSGKNALLTFYIGL